MDKDIQITKVAFFIEKSRKNREVFAIFLEKDSSVDYYNMGDTCYAHMGQHSNIHLSYVKEKCKLATEKQYKDLCSEMNNIVGYNLEVVTKLDIESLCQF